MQCPPHFRASRMARGHGLLCSGSEMAAPLPEPPDSKKIRQVIQRYIDRPLLVGGRKFHLRVYLLCVGALEGAGGSR